MPERVRTFLLIAATVGCLVYAFLPPGRPTWIGVAGGILGIEPLARARPREAKA